MREFERSAIALVTLLLGAWSEDGDAQVLDKRGLLARQDWWDNRDFDWFAARVPAFESPDTAIDATYYYRWELITKHLIYGSPESGYTFTEFIDRPFWSGTYGAISCPLGHQLEEIRWLDDRRIIEDFARYWFETPGAQPRSYSNWYGAAIWATYEVLGDTAFLRRMLPHMKRQYAGWVAEHWDAKHRMFRWDGLHDGMERNINSRQTDDIDAGAEGYRPTLNSYLYADAMAIARASAVLGDSGEVWEFVLRADSLRQRVHEELWDVRREFFLHQFARDEKDGVRALTRTYDSGTYAGNAHGRELIGYVPWQFNLPEKNKGYERAWRFLMDTAYFLAPYGPTTTERHDPQFFISPRCCWWSGNSWPYATTQTLVAMANLLNNYEQDFVSARDWMMLFGIYTRTHRKNGKPYVAEAAHPDNGSWEGHDTPYHSEHYFHSAYANLVITGLVGLRPRADDSVEVNPLTPQEWGYFALDDVSYHGYRISVLWDRDGTRYGLGRGFMILADGQVIARSAQPRRLVVHLGPVRPEGMSKGESPTNFAVNNGRGAFPWIEASYSAPENPPMYLIDGNYWYHEEPANRWTTVGSPNEADTVTIDFGTPRLISLLKPYFLDDGPSGKVRAPARFEVQYWRNDTWVSPRLTRATERPKGRQPNAVVFSPARASRVRIVVVPERGGAVGMTELEVSGVPTGPLTKPTAVSPDLAYGARATASFTSPHDRLVQINDGQVAFTKYSRNRWTAYQSPNASDWVAIDFGSPKLVSTIELYLFGDDGGIKSPRNYTVQTWDGTTWRDARVRSRLPERPLASARNVVTIDRVRTSRIRVVLEHPLPAFSGITELMVR